jgi:hypothetical protein
MNAAAAVLLSGFKRARGGQVGDCGVRGCSATDETIPPNRAEDSRLGLHLACKI